MSHVYIAPLKDKTAFKIGKAEKPMTRLTQLTHYYDIDTERLIIVKCHTTSNAYELESMLHNILGDFKTTFDHDGGTEFFDYIIYDQIVAVCLGICKLKKYTFEKYEPDTSVQTPTPYESITYQFSNRIRNKRLALNLTQAKLAKTVGISKRTIERLEVAGQATFVNVVKILSALGLEKELLKIHVPVALRQRAKKEIFVGDSDHEPEQSWTRMV